MNEAVLVLYLLNLALIGLLPKLFFKKGKLNCKWWLTAAPFFLCSIILIAGYINLVHPVSFAWRYQFEILSVPFSVASIGMIFFTLGTHRSRIALWHQNDPPENIVTYGAYQYVRHPFYASFLLTLVGAFLFFPHILTLLLLAYGLFILNFTAAREERFLSASAWGSEYEKYKQRTGRFLPKWK